MRRWVLHVDMDAFFASVEQLTRPTLRGRPVLVGGVGPRGTVAGASYESREYGARSAMPMAEARRSCPPAVVLPPRFRVYQAVSRRVFGLVRASTDLVQQVSVDEAFLEPPELVDASTGRVQEFARELRGRIATEVGVTASVGAGGGKQLAKIASGLAKPDGMLVVAQAEEAGMLAALPVRKLWGIGPVSETKLHRIGVRTVGDLASMQHNDVTTLLGQAHGTELHRLAHGIDDHPVAERAESKQVGAETTFDTDVTDPQRLGAEVDAMARAAHRRLVSSDRAARTVTVKVRDSDFTTINRSATFGSATSDPATLNSAARKLVRVAVPPGTPVRLVGVSYSGLTNWEQEPLFGEQAEDDAPETTGAEPADVAGGVIAPRHQDRPRTWRAGDDVQHPEFGHGWVQGAGHGRVTVRFETAGTGPGRARTFTLPQEEITAADPLDSLAWDATAREEFGDDQA